MTPPRARHDLATAAGHLKAGRLAEAEAACRALLAGRPAGHPEAPRLHALLGAALMKQGRFDAGIAAYGQAIALAPQGATDWLAEANFEMALVLRRRGQSAAAAAALEQVIALRPDAATAHNNLGLALKDLRRFEEAVGCFRRAIELDPRFALAHINLGEALYQLDDTDAALAALRTGISLLPAQAEGHNNLGTVLHSLGRIDEARQAFDRAVACNPAHAVARCNRSHLILMEGDFAAGFAEYEWRRKGGVPGRQPPAFDRPEWTGEPLAGRTIVLHTEQGFGDALQFARFVPAVEALGGAVILQVQVPLLALLTRSFPAARVLANDQPLPPFDCHAPLMSLPWRLGTTLDTLPARVPYLVPDPAKLAHWRARLAPVRGLKVGLVWSGSPTHGFDRRRSIPAQRLLEHLPAEDVALFSLQKDVRPADQAALADRGGRVVDLSAALGDFSDTAAAVSALDLMISIDSAVAHLAGALACPTWVLLPHALDWRWLRGRADSPWYPTARLFRQQTPGAWPEALARAGSALRELASGQPRRGAG